MSCKMTLSSQPSQTKERSLAFKVMYSIWGLQTPNHEALPAAQIKKGIWNLDTCVG